MFNKINLSLLSVNCSHARIKNAEILKQMLSGGLEVSFSKVKASSMQTIRMSTD